MALRDFALLVVVAACSAACSDKRPPPKRLADGAASAPEPARARSSALPAQATRVVELWPEGVPGLLADAPPERIEDERVYNVSVPTLSLFPAPTPDARRAGVIVCPGGGYVRLAVTNEGSDVTRYLNSLGVSAFVLKYRVAPYRHPAPLRDVLRAVRWVRAHAEELGVDAGRVGVFGSSAGGHLAASAGTLFASPDGKTGAPLDTVSARPDFIALLYPVITMKDPSAHVGSRKALLGPEPAESAVEATSLELHVGADSPPTFIVHTAEDRSVPVENSVAFYGALRKAAVPAEMHLYEKGPHGFGLRKDLGPASEWPARFAEWLRARGLLAP